MKRRFLRNVIGKNRIISNITDILRRSFVLVLIGMLGGALLFAQTEVPSTDSPSIDSSVRDELVDETTLKIKDSSPITPDSSIPGPPSELNFWDFVRMFLILIVVIFMIIGLIFLLRRFSGQAGPMANSLLRILHSQTLGGTRAIHVIELGKEIFLIGSGESSVSLIKEITDQETIDGIYLASSQARNNVKARHFGSILSQILGNREKIFPRVEEPVENSKDFLKKQRERLKKL